MVAVQRVDGHVPRLDDRPLPARGHGRDAQRERPVRLPRDHVRERRGPDLPVDVERARIDGERHDLVDVVVLGHRDGRRVGARRRLPRRRLGVGQLDGSRRSARRYLALGRCCRLGADRSDFVLDRSLVTA